ncbi:inosine 5-monophosphate dehydrogenase [Pseudobythopirellula maris]|uniref:Inosine 5-monophosphate dehydrogenase n=1 Tax=Pseudobythopirellula maris TaxID=2527991 RepID=A0A5C5ZSC7_9BACT|nr:CBS domain-containing protein [Pseudobythopirellula maris]TWT89113.1 inosine 5-monophosphate dehydrogenase [Pseudobythopirellula maris]
MGLLENLQTEPIARADLRAPVTVATGGTVREAIRAMRERALGCVVVIDGEHRPMGVFTEGMLRTLMAENPAAVNDPLAEHMSRNVCMVRTSDPMERVLQAMIRDNTRFVSVLDDDGRLVGLTGQKGLMEYIAEHFPAQVMVQRIGTPHNFRKREGA